MHRKTFRLATLAVCLCVVAATGVAEEPKTYEVGPSLEPIAVRGRVVDFAGEPVADCKVVAVSVVNDFGQFAETTTDSDGGYDFGVIELPARTWSADAYLPRSGSFEVIAVPENGPLGWDKRRNYTGREPRHPNERDLHPGEDAIINLVVPEAWPIKGRLLDDGGSPIVGATVAVVYADTLLPLDRSVWTDEDRILEALHGNRSFTLKESRASALGPERGTAKTGDDGSFEITEFEANLRTWVQISHPDFPTGKVVFVTGVGHDISRETATNISQEIEPEIYSDRLDITIPRPNYATVKIVNFAGEPAVGSHVAGSFRFMQYESVADESGEVRLPIFEGDNSITVTPNIKMPARAFTESVYLDPSAGIAGPFEIRFPNFARIRLRAIDREGNPVKEMMLWRKDLRDDVADKDRFRTGLGYLLRFRPEDQMFSHLWLRTNGAGVVTDFLPAGHYSVGLAKTRVTSIEKPDVGETIELKPGEERTIEFTVPD